MLGTINYRNLVLDDVAYSAMPMFHGNAMFAAFAPAAFVGCTFAMRRKFSASGFLPDVLRFVATYFNDATRATALGVTLGIGRIGAVLAIAGGGVLVAAQLGTFANFSVWSIAALVGIIAVLTVPRKKPAPTASPRM